MKAIWLACCACGDYGLLQREVEGRDVGAQVLRVGDLDGLVSMARAFPSRRGAAIIAADVYKRQTEYPQKSTVCRIRSSFFAVKTVYEKSLPTVLTAAISVSYTHLDVYKRQS